ATAIRARGQPRQHPVRAPAGHAGREGLRAHGCPASVAKRERRSPRLRRPHVSTTAACRPWPHPRENARRILDPLSGGSLILWLPPPPIPIPKPASIPLRVTALSS